MADKIVNPLTGRSILLNGPTHRALIDEGIDIDPFIPFTYNFPREITKEIAIRSSPQKIINYCRSDKQFFRECSSKYFWKEYFQNDQELLHDVLIEFAKKGETKFFELIWNSDIALIKERRTLKEAHELFYKGGQKEFSRKLWRSEEEWFGIFYPYLKGTDKRDYIEVQFNMEEASQKGDKDEYVRLYNISKMVYPPEEMRRKHKGRLLHEYELIENLLLHSGVNAMDIDFLKFLISLISSYESTDPVLHFILLEEIVEGIANMALKKGRYTFVTEMVDEGLVAPERITWNNLIESSRNDSIELLMEREFEEGIDLSLFKNRIYILNPSTFDDISSIGNKYILENYIRDFPEEVYVLISSYKAVSAEDFIKVFKTVADCLGEDYLADLIELLEDDGYDYLKSLVVSEIPTCESLNKPETKMFIETDF